MACSRRRLCFPVDYSIIFFAPGFAAIGSKTGDRLRNERVVNDYATKPVAPVAIKQEEIVHGTDSTN